MEILNYEITNKTPKHVSDIITFYKNYAHEYSIQIDPMYTLENDYDYDMFLTQVAIINSFLNRDYYKYFNINTSLYSVVCDLWEKISEHVKHTELWRVLIYGYKMTEEYRDWVYSLSIHISNHPFENHQENILKMQQYHLDDTIHPNVTRITYMSKKIIDIPKPIPMEIYISPQEYVTEIKKWTEKIDTLNQNNNDLQKERDELSQNVQKLTDENKALTESGEESKTRCASFSSKNAELENKIVELNTKIGTLKAGNKNYKNQYEDQEKHIIELKNQGKNMRDENDELKAILEDTTRQLNMANESIFKLGNQGKNALENNNQLQQENVKNIAKIAELQQDKDVLLEKLKLSKQDLEQQNKNAADARKELEEQIAELQKTCNEKEAQYKRDLHQQQEKIKLQTEELLQHKENHSDCEDRVKKLNEQIEQLKKQLKELAEKHENEDFDKLQRDVQLYKQMNEKLNEKFDHLQVENKLNEDNLQKLIDELEMKNVQVRDLDLKNKTQELLIEELKTNKDVNEKNAQTSMKNLQEELDKNKSKMDHLYDQLVKMGVNIQKENMVIIDWGDTLEQIRLLKAQIEKIEAENKQHLDEIRKIAGGDVKNFANFKAGLKESSMTFATFSKEFDNYLKTKFPNEKNIRNVLLAALSDKNTPIYEDKRTLIGKIRNMIIEEGHI